MKKTTTSIWPNKISTRVKLNRTIRLPGTATKLPVWPKNTTTIVMTQKSKAKMGRTVKMEKGVLGILATAEKILCQTKTKKTGQIKMRMTKKMIMRFQRLTSSIRILKVLLLRKQSVGFVLPMESNAVAGGPTCANNGIVLE